MVALRFKKGARPASTPGSRFLGSFLAGLILKYGNNQGSGPQKGGQSTAFSGDSVGVPYAVLCVATHNTAGHAFGGGGVPPPPARQLPPVGTHVFAGGYARKHSAFGDYPS